MNWFIVFFSLINISVCIYEDQIGKFDWRQTYVGRIKFAQFDTVSTAKKIIVATEENVLAALNLKTGQVVWRHVFETASTGNIQLLHVGEKVTTVTGSNPYLVRGWDSNTGVLIWEWSLTVQNDLTEYSQWWVQNNMLVHVLPVFGSHIEVTMYNLLTGNNRGASSMLPAVWTSERCIFTGPYYTCISGPLESQLLLSIDVTSNAVKIISKPLADYVDTQQTVSVNLRPLGGNSITPSFVIGNDRIVFIRDNNFEKSKVQLGDKSASATVVDGANGHILVQTWMDDVTGFTLKAHSVSTGKEVMDIYCSDKTLNIPKPELLAVMCTRTTREQNACRLLVNAADDAVHLMQQGGRALWSREEALSRARAVEFVELPVSDTDAALESEFGQKEAAKVYSSVWSAFARRLLTQYQQLQNLVRSLQGESAVQNSSSSLVRDYFNLHRIIVIVTDAGKIFGIDNLSGAILWRRYEAALSARAASVYTRRSARTPPHHAHLSVIAAHRETGNGFILSLNPITGELIDEGKLILDVRLLQCMMLHVPDSEKLHALVLLDEKENVMVLPSSAAPLVEDVYMYVAEKDTAKVQGYSLRYDGKAVRARRTWAARLGGAGAARVALRARPAALAPHCAQQDATASDTGHFRIRGLLPGCVYVVELKESVEPELAGMVLARQPPPFEVKEKDIEDVRLIVVQPNHLTDANVLIRTPNVDHYKTLRLTLALESAPHNPIYSTKLDPIGYNQFNNPGLMYTMPRLPADNKTYVVQIESTLSKVSHSYEEPAFYFNSDGKFRSFDIDFEPKLRSSEQELRHSPLALLALLSLGALYSQRARLAALRPRRAPRDRS